MSTTDVISENVILFVFWGMVLYAIGEAVYMATWAERRAGLIGLILFGLMLWAIAHFGISFPA